ncbi:MAG: type II toxin-antitoxin system RelE/ParE family toxin [Candidatus Diapherotrites archaeon]
MFEIRFSSKAEKAYKKTNSKILQRIDILFKKIEKNPIPAQEFDLKKISGTDETYRIRLSSFRVLYSVYWEEKIIRILKIEKRKSSTYKF